MMNPSGGCQIPTGIDLGDYLHQQQQQQQYENQQMAEKVKAQFEQVMKEVSMKKHRYAMTEFTSLCACASESYNIYQTMFVENAKNLNLTDIVDLDAQNSLPYQAKNIKEARELIFGGMFYALCTSVGTFMNFVQQVENILAVLNGVTPAPGK